MILLRIIILAALALLAYFYLPPGLVDHGLYWALALFLFAGGYPYAPPLGRCSDRARSGALMTALWAALSLATYLAGLDVKAPAIALSAWAFQFGAWPMRHYPPKYSLLPPLLLLALSPIPVPEAAYTSWLAASAALGVFFVFQGYIYRRLYVQPRIGMASLALALPAAYLLYRYAPALSTPLLFWSIFFSWFLEYGRLKLRQPARGAVALATGLAFSLGAAALLGISAFLPYVLLTGLIYWSAWLTWPLPPPLLPAMPPPGQRDVAKLREWL